MSTFDGWNNNELYHWGVLGMKWGIRKYQNKDGSLTPAGKKRYLETGEYGYTYKSHATKKYDRKAAKAASKGDMEKVEKFKQRADISRQLDKREENYARSVKAGGNIAARLLTGYIGTKPYQQHLAMNGKQQSMGSKVASTLLTYMGGYTISYLRKAAVIRSNEDTRFGSLGRNIGGNTTEFANKKKYQDRANNAYRA